MFGHILTTGVCEFDYTKGVANWWRAIGVLAGVSLLKPLSGSLQRLILNVLGSGAAAAKKPDHTEDE
jgi:hypothetical protein